MFYINSAINPILYNTMSSRFRDRFRRVFGCGKRGPLLFNRKRSANQSQTSSTRSVVRLKYPRKDIGARSDLSIPRHGWNLLARVLTLQLTVTNSPQTGPFKYYILF